MPMHRPTVVTPKALRSAARDVLARHGGAGRRDRGGGGAGRHGRRRRGSRAGTSARRPSRPWTTSAPSWRRRAARCGDVVRLQTFLTHAEDIAGFMARARRGLPELLPGRRLPAQHAPRGQRGWCSPSCWSRSRRWRSRPATPAAARRRQEPDAARKALAEALMIAGARAVQRGDVLRRPPRRRGPRRARWPSSTTSGSLTYAGLQELVNRTGNALLDLGVRARSSACSACCSTRRSSSAAFWGAIKIGAMPDPGQHDDAGRRLSLLPRRQPRPGRGRLGAAAGRGRARRSRRRAICEHVVVAGQRVRRRRSPSTSWVGQGLGAARGRRHARRTTPRSGSTPRAPPAVPKGAVHLQHDMVVCCDTYALQVLGHDRGRPDLLGGQALLRLRPRQQHVLPACAWAARACSTRTGRRRRPCSS